MSQNQGLLVDTGFFIAMYDERDAHHAEAQDKRKLLDVCAVILPWPALYETINTRFFRRRGIVARYNPMSHPKDTA